MVMKKVFCLYFYLEFSHHRRVTFIIIGLSSLEFESTAEISESMKLGNFF